MTENQLSKRDDYHFLRKGWHIGFGLLIVLIYQHAPFEEMTLKLTILAAFVISVVIEWARLNYAKVNSITLSLMGKFMRESEMSGPSGVPYFLGSAAFVTLVFPKSVAVLALLFLVFGDPAASLIGIWLKKKRGPRWFAGKSFFGSLGSLAICFGVGTYYLLHVCGISPEISLGIAAIGASAAALTEAFPLGLDDNFSIPISSGYIVWLAFVASGL